jgi:hypothetical protein
MFIIEHHWYLPGEGSHLQALLLLLLLSLSLSISILPQSLFLSLLLQLLLCERNDSDLRRRERFQVFLFLLFPCQSHVCSFSSLPSQKIPLFEKREICQTTSPHFSVQSLQDTLTYLCDLLIRPIVFGFRIFLELSPDTCQSIWVFGVNCRLLSHGTQSLWRERR